MLTHSEGASLAAAIHLLAVLVSLHLREEEIPANPDVSGRDPGVRLGRVAQ
jgi:hypothetical protein